MTHAKRIALLGALLICSVALSGAILQKGEQFLPFSLVSSLDDTYTVTLEEGRLTVKIQPASGDDEKILHPDAVLLDFWATWCVPCRQAMPHMQKLHEKYSPAENAESGGMILLGISIDAQGNKVVKPFFNKLDFTYPMLADPTEGDDQLIRTSRDMKSAYKAQAIPVVYLIDSKGIIQHAHTGFKEKDIEDIENAINSLAKGDDR